MIKKNKLDIDKTIMIGDREHDVKGAVNNKIDCVGVGYGYGSKEELLYSGARYFVSNVSDIRELFNINKA